MILLKIELRSLPIESTNDNPPEFEITMYGKGTYEECSEVMKCFSTHDYIFKDFYKPYKPKPDGGKNEENT